MKFAFATLAFAAAALAAPASLESRQTGWCVISQKSFSYGYTEQFAYDLARACANNDEIAASADLWSNKVCVAAALVSAQYIGPNTVVGAASCKNPTGITSQQALPSLNYNVYADIVGDCAWQEGGCPMTQQNFIDLIYSSISEIGTNRWPSSVDVILDQGWKLELDWTKTGDTIPYLNLNDFLHYA